MLQHTSNPDNEADISYANLLPEFRACQNYADRLTFWQKHHLQEQLCYATDEYDDSDGGVAVINFGMRLLANCKTWEDVKQWPILTLAPFTLQEAQQFVEWAQQIRPGMNRFVEPFESLRADFLGKYYSYDRPEDQGEYLADAQRFAKYWFKGELSPNQTVSRNNAGAIGIDLDLFKVLIKDRTEKRPIVLENHIRLGNINMNWETIDTYLFAKSKYEYGLFLERFDTVKDQPEPAPVQAKFTKLPDDATDESSTSTIYVIPDARLALIEAILPYVGESQHESLKALINDSVIPAHPILCSCEQVVLGKIFYERVKATSKEYRGIQGDKTKLAKWICQNFCRNDSGGTKKLTDSVILNHLKNKGFAKYR